MSQSRRVLEAARKAPAAPDLPGMAPEAHVPAVRIFYLERQVDLSGVSGTGIVGIGIIFPNGWCSMCWLTDHNTVTFFPSIEEVQAVHGHDGATRIMIQQVAPFAEMELA